MSIRVARNPATSRRSLLLFVFALAALFSPRTAADELRPRILDLEILTQPLPSYRLKAQTWGRILQELGYSPRFRSPRAGETPGLEDQDIAGQRLVSVVALLNSDGTLQIGSQKFREGNVAQLQETLQAIERYGAAGPPSESPTWGLTNKQYTTVVDLMAAPVTESVSLRSPVTAIDSIRLPPNCRLQFTEAARNQALTLTTPADDVEADFSTLSKGTALAIALSQFGLGFRPLSNPEGGYIIEVDAGGEDDNLWPVGWKSTEPINRSLPEMFKSVDVTLQDVELPALIKVISDQLQVPHYYSSTELGDSGVNVTELTYDRRPDRISMARLMTIVGDQFRIGLDVRVAENGTFFLWVTTRDEYLAFRSRFSHVVPGR